MPVERLTVKTELGIVTVTTSTAGLLSLSLSSSACGELQPGVTAELSRLIEPLEAYFRGEKVDFAKFNLDLSSATPFQRKVWEAARLIPYGETRSYRWISVQIGQPKAVRAVGQALGRNPLPVIIPCHRVIAGDGRLCGFSCGLEMKRALLRLEKATIG